MNNWYLLAAIPVFGLLVFVHELGHFIAARWAGIRVEEFGLGFPPNVVSFRKRDRGGWEVIWFGRYRDREIEGKAHQTIYSLNLLPLGGFVRMPGENGAMLDEHGSYDTGSFAAKSASKRIIVLCAGVFMNFLLASVLFTLANAAGEPKYDPSATLGLVEPGSPAALAGLRADDKVISVNARPVQSFSEMVTMVRGVTQNPVHKGKTSVPLNLVVQHKGDSKPISVTVNARVNPAPNQGAMGVGQNVIFVSAPWWQAPLRGIAQTFDFTREFVTQIGQMIIGKVKPELAGPVGITKITGEVAQRVPDLGWWPIFNLTGILSLNLAIINILPFPALDGGRIVLILVELVRGGKRLKPEREGIINFIGFAILLALMVLVTIGDVARWGG
jgi:regulator of sigma E protease